MSNSSQPCPYVSHAMNWRTSVPVWTNVVESVPALGARAGLWTGAGVRDTRQEHGRRRAAQTYQKKNRHRDVRNSHAHTYQSTNKTGL